VSLSSTDSAFDNYYLQAQKVRRMVQLELDSLFRVQNPLSNAPDHVDRTAGVDFLVHPSALSTAPLLSSALRRTTTTSVSSDQAAATSKNAYLQDLLTVPASLAGLPALSLPAGRDAQDGWPVGVTVMGQWGSDRAVLQVARRWEELRNRRGEWRPEEE
jgi:aspartyl-tRNA(Asn)/glutamyl-tRNA(Gln) amidotransferase subunit A